MLTMTEFLDFIGRVAERRFQDQSMNLELKIFYVIRDIVGVENVTNPE